MLEAGQEPLGLTPGEAQSLLAVLEPGVPGLDGVRKRLLAMIGNTAP